MKKIILFLLIAFSINSFAQKKGEPILPTVDDKVIYTEVVQVDSSIKKEELYARAKRFFVDIYKSGKDVIQIDDKETGEITGKGFFSLVLETTTSVASAKVWHTFSIYVKDGKYKYEMKDFEVKYNTSGRLLGTAYISGSEFDDPLENYFSNGSKRIRNFLIDVSSECKKTIEKLKLAMNKKPATDF